MKSRTALRNESDDCDRALPLPDAARLDVAQKGNRNRLTDGFTNYGAFALREGFSLRQATDVNVAFGRAQEGIHRPQGQMGRRDTPVCWLIDPLHLVHFLAESSARERSWCIH